MNPPEMGNCLDLTFIVPIPSAPYLVDLDVIDDHPE